MGVIELVKQMLAINAILLEIYTKMMKVQQTCENCNSSHLAVAITTLTVAMVAVTAAIYSPEPISKIALIISAIPSVTVSILAVQAFLNDNTCDCPQEIMLLTNKVGELKFSLERLKEGVNNR